MIGKDFLSICDIEPMDVEDLLNLSQHIKNGKLTTCMKGREVALLFEKPSLRTRVSFEIGIRQLGGSCIYLDREDVGLGVREPVCDIARVLDRWVDGVVARVFKHDTLTTLAKYMSHPVVNALSDLEHPCQALGDLLTIKERKGTLHGIKMAFIGDGNNVAASLALACASVGMDFVLASPSEYRLSNHVWEKAKQRANKYGSNMLWVADPVKAVIGADVVYTDVWISMGDEKETEERMTAFKGYRVDEHLMTLAKADALFMHDMPAHRGEEISDSMLDHCSSVVFDQAENRLHAQKAVLADLYSV